MSELNTNRDKRMSSIFNAYDQEYNNLSQEIQRNISELKHASSSKGDVESGSAASKTRHIDALLGQAQDLIKQMNVEVRSQDIATRKVLTEKVGTYTKALSNLRGDFERAKEMSQRSELIGEKSAADRQRLLQTNDKLRSQNEKILNATRTVMETEDVGIEITNELARNREKIQSVHGRVHEYGGITDSARRILSSMSKRDNQQKMILSFVAVVLIIAIIITIYFNVKS